MIFEFSGYGLRVELPVSSWFIGFYRQETNPDSPTRNPKSLNS